jgi:hypothetical protein
VCHKGQGYPPRLGPRVAEEGRVLIKKL